MVCPIAVNELKFIFKTVLYDSLICILMIEMVLLRYNITRFTEQLPSNFRKKFPPNKKNLFSMHFPYPSPLII